MYKRADFTKLEGVNFSQDLLAYLQSSYREPFGAIASLCGPLVIVTGVADLGTDWGDGWVCINGELLPFQGGTKAARIIIEETVAQEEYGDGNSKDFYYTRIAKLAGSGGNAFTDFVRLDTLSQKITERIRAGSDVIRYKIIEIGDWDMDTNVAVSVTHGLDHKKIRGIDVVVRNDADTEYYPLNRSGGSQYEMFGGVASIRTPTSPTWLQLTRRTGSYFDSAGFSATGYNRGWITIKYVE